MSRVFRYGDSTKGGFEGQLDGDDTDTNGGADRERTVRTPVTKKALRNMTGNKPKTKQQRRS